MKRIPRSLSFLLFCSVLASCGGSAGSDSVTGPPPVAGVKVTGPASLFEGESSQAQAALVDASGGPLSGRTITWSSSNQSVATVTAGGLITAVTAGTATLSATSEGQAGSSSLSVTRDPTAASIVLTPLTLSVPSGGSLQLATEVKNGRGQIVPAQGITYTSSAPTIAAVSGGGIVSSVGPVGVANIAASIGTIVSAPAVVTVSPGAASNAAIKGGNGQSAQAGTAVAIAPAVIVTDAYGNPVAGVQVNFSSANGALGQGASIPTNSAGVATYDRWILSAGSNTLYANVGSIPQIFFTATGF